jgi:hypothetical protein
LPKPKSTNLFPFDAIAIALFPSSHFMINAEFGPEQQQAHLPKTSLRETFVDIKSSGKKDARLAMAKPGSFKLPPPLHSFPNSSHHQKSNPLLPLFIPFTSKPIPPILHPSRNPKFPSSIHTFLVLLLVFLHP